MGSKRVLHFHFESRTLNKIVQATSEPFADADARLAYITNLYQEIEDFWAEDDQEYESFMRKLQARGVQLFDELMPKELRQALWDSQRQYRHHSGVLRRTVYTVGTGVFKRAR